MFYERPEVFHEVVEAKRSEICFNLILDLITDQIKSQETRILDVGCGDGSFITKFTKYCRVFGVDISAKAVSRAIQNGVDARNVDVSTQKLPFENGYFDLIYLGDVIEHLVDPDFAIKEVTRVTRSHGFLVVSTPNLACWENRLLLLMGVQPLFSEVSTIRIFGRPGLLPVGHLRLFTYRALKEFLQYYHFEILKVAGAPSEKLPRIPGKLDEIFSRFPSIASVIIFVSRKMD